MHTFNYGSPYLWDKVVLTKFISGCRMVWNLLCGTSWPYKSRTEKVTAGRKSAILPNWCCLLFITVLSGYPWSYFQLAKLLRSIGVYKFIYAMQCRVSVQVDTNSTSMLSILRHTFKKVSIQMTKILSQYLHKYGFSSVWIVENLSWFQF